MLLPVKVRGANALRDATIRPLMTTRIELSGDHAGAGGRIEYCGLIGSVCATATRARV